MRDDFSKTAKELLAKRVSYKCSNPKCKKITIGAHTLVDRSINLGVAAHIHAASSGGPRYSEEMKSEDRKSIQNGIWLCQNCAKLIDTDIARYSPKVLLNWKSVAEQESLSVITNDFIQHNNNSLSENRIKVNKKLYNEVSEANSMIIELINLTAISNKEKREISYYIGLQIAQFTQDNGFYIQDEISLQCVGTFVGVSDIFASKKSTRESSLENYRRNLRASLKLLKTINSEGIVDTTKKTPLMARYNELLEENTKEDFLN